MALVQHTVRDLKARGVDRITVNYWNFNTASRALFEAAGFAPVETKAELL
ncbi:hypothetical protein FIU85_02850 [Roseovarius sp. THAF8]|nr:hypothetical protein FIU85_02850 [Roseovarius sp. THAF8]